MGQGQQCAFDGEHTHTRALTRRLRSSLSDCAALVDVGEILEEPSRRQRRHSASADRPHDSDALSHGPRNHSTAVHGHVLGGGGGDGNGLLNELDNCGVEKVKTNSEWCYSSSNRGEEGYIPSLASCCTGGVGGGVGGWAEKEERRQDMVSIDAV